MAVVGFHVCTGSLHDGARLGDGSIPYEVVLVEALAIAGCAVIAIGGSYLAQVLAISESSTVLH